MSSPSGRARRVDRMSGRLHKKEAFMRRYLPIALALLSSLASRIPLPPPTAIAANDNRRPAGRLRARRAHAGVRGARRSPATGGRQTDLSVPCPRIRRGRQTAAGRPARSIRVPQGTEIRVERSQPVPATRRSRCTGSPPRPAPGDTGSGSRRGATRESSATAPTCQGPTTTGRTTTGNAALRNARGSRASSPARSSSIRRTPAHG